MRHAWRGRLKPNQARSMCNPSRSQSGPRARALGMMAIATLATIGACATPSAPMQTPMQASAAPAAAPSWIDIAMDEPLIVTVSACAHLREGVSAFNDRLTGAGLNGSASVRVQGGDFLEVARFDLRRDASLTLSLAANRRGDGVVCTLQFGGPQGAAAWERARALAAQMASPMEGGGEGPRRRFEQVKPTETLRYFFTEAERRAPATLMIDMRPTE